MGLERFIALLSIDFFKKTAKYFFVALVSFLVDLILFFVFLDFFEIAWFLSAALSFIIATKINYWLCVLFVFPFNQQFKFKNLFYLYIVSAAGLILNIAIMYFILNLFDLDIIFVKFLASCIVFCWNFFMRLFFIFKE